jgi:glycosyltransferase involved in cell wall biosynthesis
LRQVAYSVEVPASVPPAQPAADFRLVQVGTLSAGKRPEDAVRAVAELRRRGVPAHLNLVGEATGNYAAILSGLAADLKVTEHLTLVPFVADPFQYIAAADAVVVCSRGEGFGRVTIEAMKLGKAVVGANSGATSELIRHGETGLLFALGSSADLADKLERLYHDPAERVQMGDRAREWAYANYNLRRHIEQLVMVIAEVVPTPTSGQGVPGLVRQQSALGQVEPEFSAPKPPRL